MSTLIKRNKTYIIKSQFGTYKFNNLKTAQQLHNTLNTYEKTVQLHKNIDEQFDRIQKQLIQTNLSLNILKDDMEKLTTQLQQVKEWKRN